jgi:F-type H+-transporting ATPase subunit gamma
MRDIKRRIRSVKNTQQITRAMYMVAAAKLRRARERAEVSRPYFKKIRQIVGELLASSPGLIHPFVEKREVKKTGFIVVTADRGLCGGYNSNIIRFSQRNMQEKNPTIISVGKKGKEYFARRKYIVIREFRDISERPHFNDAQRIANTAIELFRGGEIDEVYLAFTSFVTTMQFKPTLIKLLPVEPFEQGEDDKRIVDELYQYEPSPDGVLNYILPKFISNTVYGALIESEASELAARMTAMDSATDNAEEMIDNLTLSFHRARKAAITKEISEIVGGAEALK